MSTHQGNKEKADPQNVEMQEHSLNDIVGAGSEPVSFATYQDYIDASTSYKDAIDQFGVESPQALEKKARFDDTYSRLYPTDK